MKDTRKQTIAGRPINPFLAGVSIGALWGAWHVPQIVGAGSLLDFAADVLALMIVSGGVCALAIEGILTGTKISRSKAPGASLDIRR